MFSWKCLCSCLHRADSFTVIAEGSEIPMILLELNYMMMILFRNHIFILNKVHIHDTS